MRRTSKRVAMPTHVGLPFDLSTVKTKPDDASTTSTNNERIFGLKEAPTFYPTKEEFKDPLRYIEKISPEGEKYGIVKIVPPEDYQPEFSLKTENFRFKTRIQKLNSMEGETRTNVNYLEQLTKYHILTGRPVGKIPQLDKRPIDLYKLKNEVALKGGVQEVTRLKKWAEIGRTLGYARKQCTSMSNALKAAYSKVILPYEIWYAKHKDDVGEVIRQEDHSSAITDNSNGESDTCEVCKKNENEEKLLLCDGCNRGYHMYCLNPPLENIPKTDWYCLQCLTAVGKDYGFEDGEEYSLGDFQKVCDKFKKQWFEKSLGEGKTVTEEQCENEFWRLVENPHETCEVEYGADLHSTHHGSGFMTAELMPQGAFDPWNLNVIPVAPQSLFTHIKTDISGMMVPWLYVGMCFSAFCWHNEDHYTYSINYMHWGETKTWYGVPGSDTHKFEETMKKAVPELFEQQPDLLFQLVTMLSPGRLLKEDVQVYAVDQRPGQFVVTYPKAYHSGFNHGFNFCEAVNFAPGEWVDYGLECVKRYKTFRKQPCFSHDELLVTAAQNMKSAENMIWLKRGLTEMKNREIKERSLVRLRKIKEEMIPSSDTREELQCVFCNCYTYLSYISCKCTDKVACLDHMSELCTCDMSSKTLYLRYTDKQLEDMAKKATHPGASPEAWTKKVDKIISSFKSDSTTKPLRDLWREGREINAPKDSLESLKDFIDAIDQWTNEAERLLSFKPDSSKSNKKRDQRTRELLDKAPLIGFDVPYVDELKDYLNKLEAFENQLTDDVLVGESNHEKMELYNEGLQLRADSDKFDKLRTLIESCSWEEQAEYAMKSTYSPRIYRKLIKDAEDYGLTSDDEPLLKQLIEMNEFGKEVLQRIDNICKGKEKIGLDEEESIMHIGQHPKNRRLSLRIDPQQFLRLKNSLTRSKNTLAEIEEMLLIQCRKPSVIQRPSLNEAQRLMSIGREISLKSGLVPQLGNEISRMSTWNELVRSTFLSTRQKSLESVLRDTLNNVQRITTSEDKPSTWCICRKAESGLMVACEICHEWYHSACLKVPRNVVKSSSSYVCPICHLSDNTKRVSHVSRQPKLEEITDLIVGAEPLKFRPKDYKIIFEIHTIMVEYRNRVQNFCRSRTQLGVEDIQKIKYYLRTLLGLEVYLQDEAEFLRSKIKSLTPTRPLPTGRKPSTNTNLENKSVKTSIPTRSENGTMTHDRKLTTVGKPLLSNHQPMNCTCHEVRKPECPDCNTEKADSPRLHLTTGNNKKRPADEVPNAKQKIIKLTVKPPSQHLNSPTSTSSSSNSKTQQYTPEEDKKHPSKKHKTI